MASNDKNFDDSNQYEPLDTIQMKVCAKNGIEATVSAIHIGFMETRFYVHFQMPPKSNISGDDSLTAEEEEWLEYMTFLEDDLHWLLKLPHQRFWSQVVYDEDLHRCLESYLSQAPRDYDVDNLNLKKELHCALKKVHRLVFLAYLRMSTYKESKKHHIRPHAFGEIIYDNFIFDIPKILDICGLYGIQNTSIVNKMVQNIFSTQPKYKNDLNETSKVILAAFNTVEEKLHTVSSKPCVSNGTNGNRDTMKNELLLYCDLINYITDVSVTMYAFLENYSPACQIFHQNGYVLRIPTFYEHVFPILEKEVARNKSAGTERTFEDIKRKIILSKTSLLRAFRNIINYTCIQNILDYKMSNSDEKLCASTLVENFLEVIMELVSNRNFLCDYNLLYPFETDLELFNELGISVDSERVNYIFCSIHDIGEVSSETFTSTVSNGARPKVKKEIESNHKPAQKIQDLVDILKPKQPDENVEQYEFIRPNEIEIDSLIQSVLDLLPTYGDGFIEKCLEYYSYKADSVIDAVLTDSLPDSLHCLDMNLTRKPKNVVSQDSHSVLSERKNIFDNDEFDMFSRNDVNMANVHIGKKNKTPAIYQTLQNDEDSEFLKQLTLASGSEETEFDFHRNLYEDEYDDTYDSAMVGLKEPLLEDAPDDDANDDEDDKEDSENSNTRQNSMNFCSDPAIAREKAEQRRQARGFHNRGRSNRGGSRPADTSDNRQNKDRHKANVGNHNRRKQSDFKKSRGMMPFPTR